MLTNTQVELVCPSLLQPPIPSELTTSFTSMQSFSCFTTYSLVWPVLEIKLHCIQALCFVSPLKKNNP